MWGIRYIQILSMEIPIELNVSNFKEVSRTQKIDLKQAQLGRGSTGRTENIKNKLKEKMRS